MTEMLKDVDYYMSLSYEKTIRAIPANEGGGYIAAIPILGTASTNAWGETEAEALDTLKIVMHNNFASWLQQGISIPEPIVKTKTYSGRYLIRMSPFLHEQADIIAQQQGISFNHLLCDALSEYVGGQVSANR